MENDNNRIIRDDERDNRKKAGWLWWLLPILLILGLAAYLLGNKDEANAPANNQQTNQSADQVKTVDNKQTNKQLYDSKFNAEARVIYFNPDTTEVQDETSTAAKIDAIVTFYKANTASKLQVNGSIFDDNQVDSTSALAKQRAELIVKRLVEKGIPAEAISTSTVDNYEGVDDAARAMYARSVTVSVTN